MKQATSSGRWSKLLAVGATFLSAVSLAAQTPVFSVRELPTLPDAPDATVSGINNAGQAVGTIGGVSFCPGGCPVIWSDGSPTLLGGVTGETTGAAYAINNAGQVAGTAVIAGSSQAVIWNNNTLTPLPSPGTEYTQTFAVAINDSGQVVGQAVGQANGVAQAVATLWNGSTPTVLGLASGYTVGLAYGINNGGLVVGKLCCDVQEPEAVVWHGTTPTLLPRLKPIQTGSGAVGNGVALAVNNSGLAVGIAASATGREEAVAWNDGVAIDLGMIEGKSSATAINDRGIIVGNSVTADGTQHAVIWSRIGAEIADLNTLISATAAAEITLTGATGINNNCVIVANGYTNKTQTPTAFVLTLNDTANCVNGL
jgi:probable HAF family extracellular repeat protein